MFITCEFYHFFYQFNYFMNPTNIKLLNDLEIQNKIIPKLDNTITIYGKNNFKKQFDQYYYDKQLLSKKKLIENIYNSPKRIGKNKKETKRN